MDRRMFFAALGGGLCLTTSALRAQEADPLGGLFALPGEVVGGTVGAGADILGGTLGGGAGAIGGDDQFRLVDLMGGEFSIETSQLALQRSRNPHVRNFAQLEINEQVSVAAALGAAPHSVAPRPDQTAMVQRLAMLHGSRFDQAYILGQIQGHQELLANNSRAIHSDADDAIRRVATLSVPTIETHLAILHRLRSGLAAV